MSSFWQKWLQVASVVLIIYGALTALAVFPAFTGSTKSMIDMVFWPPLEQAGSLGPHGGFPAWSSWRRGDGLGCDDLRTRV